jgi:DNA adenine methylase
MEYLRLIKYPGAKKSLINDLFRLVTDARPELFVDVFGGSGTVALNVSARRIVYNDINVHLVNMFRSIQLNPGKIFAMLKEEIAKADVDRRYIRYYSSVNTGKREDDLNSIKQSQIESAYETIMTYSKSFGGQGETYATSHEKSVLPYIARTIGVFGRISDRVRLWTIENLDFREILRKYDSSMTLFYLDPPYPGKRWYESSLSDIDYRDLSAAVRSINGKYIMNLDFLDSHLREIFGKPAFTKSYGKSDPNRIEGKNRTRTVSFYTNIHLS